MSGLHFVPEFMALPARLLAGSLIIQLTWKCSFQGTDVFLEGRGATCVSGIEIIAVIRQINNREGTELPKSSTLGNTTGFPQLGDLGMGLWCAQGFWIGTVWVQRSFQNQLLGPFSMIAWAHLISRGVLGSVCVLSGGFYLVFNLSQVLLSGSTAENVWGRERSLRVMKGTEQPYMHLQRVQFYYMLAVSAY